MVITKCFYNIGHIDQRFSNNAFSNNAGHFFTPWNMLTINKAELFIKAQLKPVKMTKRMLPNKCNFFYHDQQLSVNTALTTSCMRSLIRVLDLFFKSQGITLHHWSPK